MSFLISHACALILTLPVQDPAPRAVAPHPEGEAPSTGWEDWANSLASDVLLALPGDWDAGLAIDGTVGWRERGKRDRVSSRLRAVELTATHYLTDSLEVHGTLHASSGHAELDHLTLGYTDLPGDGSLHLGRMLMRFGSQMHKHEHELSTVNRPRVLEEYLGTIRTATGLHYDSFLVEKPSKSLRFFAGAYASVNSEIHGGGHDHGGEQDLDRIGFGTRLEGRGISTGSGDLQLGASWHSLPEFSLSLDGGGEMGDLSNHAVGVDALYSPSSADWSLGLEFIELRGDLRAEDASSLVSGDRMGWLLSYDRPLGEKTSVSLLLSEFEHPEIEAERETEFVAAWSWQAADFLRVRLSASHQALEHEDDTTRIMIQLTGVFGRHDHDHGHEHRH